MFKKILIPLDGSKLAECVLPYAETLAKSCDASEVILVSVTEKVKGVVNAAEVRDALKYSDDARIGEITIDVVPTIFPQSVGQVTGESRSGTLYTQYTTSVSFGKLEGQAQKYLKKIEKKLKTQGIPVRNEVLIGSPAEQIIKYAGDQQTDLIMMSSHGRSGPSRWAMGSVSDKVFRGTCIPVLLIRSPGCGIGI